MENENYFCREYEAGAIKYLELDKPESTLKQLKSKGVHLNNYTKAKILAKNTVFELTASMLEILCMPFKFGGLSVSFDGIRDKKINL